MHYGEIAIQLLAHVMRSLNSSRRIAHQPQLGGRAGNLVETSSRPVGGHGARGFRQPAWLRPILARTREMDLTCASATSWWPRPWPDGLSYCCWPSAWWPARSEAHTSELQSLMRISYAV